MPWKRRFVIGASSLLGVSAGFIVVRQWERMNRVSVGYLEPEDYPMPKREDHLLKLQSNQTFDMIVIGGGATGSGIALDAITRGYSVALVEQEDFSSGTSSRSTKLVHGGVRYLEKAVRELDYEQYQLVREALHERKNFLTIAPHLSYELPIMIPVYSWIQIPYYWLGAKVYDLFAGKSALQSSYFMSKATALETYPHLARDALKAAIVYHDGAHNDSRMNLSIALTAAKLGAAVANHTKVLKLLKNPQGKLCGVQVRDEISGKLWEIHGKVVVNATGPFSDAIRKMDDPSTADIVCPSAGVHVILPDYFSPKHMGLLDANTSDGRVIYFLPWEHSVIAGTTDTPTSVTMSPKAKEEEIRFVLKEISSYLASEIKVRRSDVLAAWSGIRPLVIDPSKKSTEGIARTHLVCTSESGLVTVAGGKWTTYRQMAEDTVDAVEKILKTPHRGCKTENTLLIGAHGYNDTLKIRLIQQFGLEAPVSEHLARSYGDRAFQVASLAQPTGKRWPPVGRRLANGYPYIEAEVVYSVRNEMACSIVDVVARRTRLAFVNATAAADALPKIGKIMQKELGWDDATLKKQLKDAQKFLYTMGYRPAQDLDQETVDEFRVCFDTVDLERSGVLSYNQTVQALYMLGYSVSKPKLKEWFSTCGNESNTLEFSDFVDLASAIREGKGDLFYSKSGVQPLATNSRSISRSGGGV